MWQSLNVWYKTLCYFQKRNWLAYLWKRFDDISKHLIGSRKRSAFVIKLTDVQVSEKIKENMYNGNLNSEHLNCGNIWIANFYLFANQMTDNNHKHWMTLFTLSVENRHLENIKDWRVSMHPSVKQPMTWIANY